MSVFINCTKSPQIPPEEKALLQQIKESLRYPISRFELRSTNDSALISTALNYVSFKDKHATMDEVKARANLLIGLEEKGLIEVSFSMLTYVKSDYLVYYNSDLFALLNETVEEGRGQEGFLFDTTFLKVGIAKLTLKGKYAAY